MRTRKLPGWRAGDGLITPPQPTTAKTAAFRPRSLALSAAVPAFTAAGLPRRGSPRRGRQRAALRAASERVAYATGDLTSDRTYQYAALETHCDLRVLAVMSDRTAENRQVAESASASACAAGSDDVGQLAAGAYEFERCWCQI